MSDQWHLLNDGQQYGPYSGEDLVRFVQEGRIVRETLLWTDGMESWLPASAIEGLFPQVAAAVPVAQAVGPRPVSAAANRATQRVLPTTKLATQSSKGGSSANATKKNSKPVPAGPYPALAIRPANFELLMTLIGSGLVLLAIAAWAKWTMGQSDAPIPGIPVDPTPKANQQLMLIVILVAAGGCLVSWMVLNFMYLHRIWASLQHGRPRSTPGKAVGLLFVPLFNYYWLFVAFYGLAQDWNRITNRFTDLNRAPKFNEGLFLAYCICSIVLPPVALVLWFPVMMQVCRGISFMALPPVHRARMSRPK